MMNESTVQNPGMGYQFEDAISRAEADWYCHEDTRPLRRAIAEDVWPLVSGWLMGSGSVEIAKLWADIKKLSATVEEVSEEVGWWRATYPDVRYPDG